MGRMSRDQAMKDVPQRKKNVRHADGECVRKPKKDSSHDGEMGGRSVDIKQSDIKG